MEAVLPAREHNAHARALVPACKQAWQTMLSIATGPARSSNTSCYARTLHEHAPMHVWVGLYDGVGLGLPFLNGLHKTST